MQPAAARSNRTQVAAANSPHFLPLSRTGAEKCKTQIEDTFDRRLSHAKLAKGAKSYLTLIPYLSLTQYREWFPLRALRLGETEGVFLQNS